MKRFASLVCAMALAVPVMGQEYETTTVTTTTTRTTTVGGANLLDELWYVQDAVPLTCGQVDLRLTFGWETASFPANRGSDDNFFFTPSLVWGAAENFELSIGTPIWLGDGGDVGTLTDSNYDTHLGMLVRFVEQDGFSMGLGGRVRVPTGCRSNGVDAELRLTMTNEYDSGVRSHFNVFGVTVNGNNEPDMRHFQWGLVVGLDGPLCGDGSVRWVADYQHRSSFNYGFGNLNQAEVGWEWAIADAHKLGMSVQVGLDGVGQTPNFGAIMTYAVSLTY